MRRTTYHYIKPLHFFSLHFFSSRQTAPYGLTAGPSPSYHTVSVYRKS